MSTFFATKLARTALSWVTRRLVFAMLVVTACRGGAKVPAGSPTPVAVGSGSAPATPAQPTTTAPGPPGSPGPLGECGASCWTSPDGFRFVHPLPHGETLRSVQVMPDGEVWIAGENAALWRIDRSTKGTPKITRITVPDVPTVADVFDEIEPGASARDFPGTQLMKLDFDTLLARDRNDVWIAVGAQELVHWDGTNWTHHRYKDDGGEELMFGPDGKLWAAGKLGAAVWTGNQRPLIFDGKKLVDGPQMRSKERARAIAWQGKDVWVAGSNGMLLRSRGGKPFESVAVPDKDNFDAMWLDQDGTAGYVAGYGVIYKRERDGFVRAHKVKGSIAAVHAFGDGEPAWFVGDSAWLLEGGTLREVPIEGYTTANMLSLGVSRFESVHGRTPDDVWFVGRAGLIAHWDGKKLEQVFPRMTEEHIHGLAWLDGDNWLAAAGDGTLITGSLAKGVTGREPSPMTERDVPRVLATTRAGELILAGCHTEMFKRDKRGTWTKLPKLKGCVSDVHGTDADHLWAVGTIDFVATAWKLDGGKWIAVPTHMPEHEDLNDVEVAANGDVWMAGVHVVFQAKRGGKLVRVTTHKYDDYNDISIRAPDDVWFATNANEIGAAGTLVHWNGKTFERFDHLTANYLSAVVAKPDGSVWAVGLGGVATSSVDGKTFKPLQLGAQATLTQLIAHPSGALLAGGDFGAIVQR
jgi:hypothetical protein